MQIAQAMAVFVVIVTKAVQFVTTARLGYVKSPIR